MSDEQPTLAEYHAASAAAVRRGERTVEDHYAFVKSMQAAAAPAGEDSEYGPMPEMAAKLKAMIDEAKRAREPKR
jgi:hypothetical protein